MDFGTFRIVPEHARFILRFGIPQATILISKAVAVSGGGDAIIEEGTLPFYVEAPGATVTIQSVRFIRPAKSAIIVYAVSGLVIASCGIEGFTVLPNIQFSGIAVIANDMAVTPSPNQPGHPENLSGRRWQHILENVFTEGDDRADDVPVNLHL